MKIWITRSLEDGQSLASEITARGHDVVVSPLINVNLSGIEPLRLNAANGFIFTSRNGVRALIKEPIGDIEFLKEKPVFSVGSATSKIAREFGFEKIFEGSGDAQSLVPLIKQQNLETLGRLIHLRGDATAFDLMSALLENDISIDELIVYYVKRVDELSRSVIDALQRDEVCGVMLMSARTARYYLELMSQSGMGQEISKLQHICLSRAFAEVLEAVKVTNIKVASVPTREALIDCLNN